MIQNPMISGKKLPTLTNPAGAANIQAGYEAIDGSGNIINGEGAITATYKIKLKNEIGSMLKLKTDELDSSLGSLPSSMCAIEKSDSAGSSKSLFVFSSTKDFNISCDGEVFTLVYECETNGTTPTYVKVCLLDNIDPSIIGGYVYTYTFTAK